MRKRKKKEKKGKCLWCEEPITYKLIAKPDGCFDLCWGFCDKHALDYIIKIMNEGAE